MQHSRIHAAFAHTCCEYSRVQEDTTKKECYAVFRGGNSAVGQPGLLPHSKHLLDHQTMFLH